MKIPKREAGVLLHPTSLPSRYGVGDIGKNAQTFIDKISKTGCSLWQTLPLGPTGFGDSPYAARSAFAGNEILIDPRSLCEKGYLSESDVMTTPIVSERVDYGKAKEVKMPLLRKAAIKFLKKKSASYKKFCQGNSFWLDDYALFQVLCNVYNDSRWFLTWPDDVRDRKKEEIDKLTKKYSSEIEIYKAYQYFFFSQWGALKAYAKKKGVKIIGDMPIFVAPDSSDAWTGRRLLKIDGKGVQETSSGVPPDAFSATGQLWGNPTYRWSEHEKDGFAWWVSRLRHALGMFDIVRIDHFRGFAACWEVPHGAKTAAKGKWVPSPGKELLEAFKSNFGPDLPLIAEDLGVITPDVEALRDDNGLPGMKILHFAFGWKDGAFDSSNPYLPHNIGYGSAVYTGTHDNDTTLGWYNSLDEGTKDIVRRYLECDDSDIVYRFVRAALMTHAKYCVIPMQDVLALGSEARMNVPSTCGTSNWSWRMTEKMLADDNMGRMQYYVTMSGRKA